MTAEKHHSDPGSALIVGKHRACEERSKNSDVDATPGDSGYPEPVEDIEVTDDGASFPPSASMFHKCSTKALVLMDGCATCLDCGYSKCG